jgi:hypothetical protein
MGAARRMASATRMDAMDAMDGARIVILGVAVIINGIAISRRGLAWSGGLGGVRQHIRLVEDGDGREWALHSSDSGWTKKGSSLGNGRW